MLLIHHAATLGGAHPPSSLSGLRACIAARARVVEVDVVALRGGGFALLHGPSLEGETDGQGPVAARTAEEVAGLQRVWRGAATGEPVGLLAGALDLIRGQPLPQELQLDLKPEVLATAEVLGGLVQRAQPFGERIRVSSPADWVLRGLHALDLELALGFDPLLYLDLDWGEDEAGPRPPFRVGAYGYRDDHPLALRRWGSTAGYLAARAEALWAQAPFASVWYISAPLLAQALDDGFDWIAYVHGRGAEVAAWTLDAGRPGDAALARRLAAAGADRITTDDPAGLASVLDAGVAY